VGRLIIGIDEVGKIRDSHRAKASLHDIKAIFGIPSTLSPDESGWCRM
jgi:hypothetical protein